MARSKKYTKFQQTVRIIITIIIIAVAIYGYLNGWYDPEPPMELTGELEIHLLDMGNEFPGDAIYIKAGDNDILVDAGSDYDSVDDITKHINQYCTDNTLEYVIVTHADFDHIACLAGDDDGKPESLFDNYKVENIIQFARTTKDTGAYNLFDDKCEQEVAEGANRYTALDCCKEINGAQKIYQLTESIRLEILYQKYYETNTSKENNYSVCFLLTHGDKKFLFTGDLEEAGEKSLVEESGKIIGDVDFYKAGHHGSAGSSGTELLSLIKPEIVAVTCVAGSKYGFPTQTMLDNVSKYTDEVYVLSMMADNEAEYAPLNGTIYVSSTVDGITVNGANNNTLFKDTDWCKQNREMPTAWIS